MIYISSACLKSNTTDEAVDALGLNGFRNIELSRGSKGECEIGNLLSLKEKYSLRYLCHNHFAMSGEGFVINLASADDDIYNRSLEYLKRAIQLSRDLGAEKFGMHAGFLIDIGVSELGRVTLVRKMFDRDKSLARFCRGYRELVRAGGGMPIYIENNGYAKENADAFGTSPFFLVDYSGYEELAKEMDFSLLLDIAHLKVSCGTLGLDFSDDLEKMISVSDYLHLSETDGIRDSNSALSADSAIAASLKGYDLSKKTVTLEIYGGLEEIKQSYETVNSWLLP